MPPYRYLPSTLGQIVDRLGAMALCFPEHQLPLSDLEMTDEFEELRESLGIVRSKLGEERYASLIAMSRQSEQSYLENDELGGGRTLREMQALIRKRR